MTPYVAVCLDSIDEVRAVHKMLFNRKFDGPEDVYFGSPFIASVQHKLADALAAESGGDGAEDWAAWRNANAHPHVVEKIRRHLSGLGSWWAEEPPAKRQAYVRDLLAPLLADDALLGELTGLPAGSPSSSQD